jgi:hypothetical protein
MQYVINVFSELRILVQSINPKYLHQYLIGIIDNESYTDDKCSIRCHAFLLPDDQLVYQLYSHQHRSKGIEYAEIGIKKSDPGNKKVFCYPGSQVNKNQYIKNVVVLKQLPSPEEPEDQYGFN